MNRPLMMAIALTALAAGGCNEGASGTADAEAAFHLCTTWSGAINDRRAACESWSAAYQALRIGELAAGCEHVRRSVSARREHFDSANSEGCLLWLETTFAAAACSSDEPTPPAVCNEVIQPLVPLGGACGENADCIDGRCSFPAGTCIGAGTGTGTCVRLGAEGDPCAPLGLWPFPGSECGAGLACYWSGSFTCGVPPIPAGEDSPCGIGTPCGAGLFCDFSDVRFSSPTCKPIVGLGDPCPSPMACPTGLVCGTQGVCAQYVGERASCTAATTECGAGLFCNGSLCEALPDIGASCAVSQECVRGYCSSIDSICQPRKANGQCANFDECASYICSDGFCEPPICP